jgi:hypothetical protein
MTDKKQADAITISKKKANSGKVSYGNAVVIHETSQTKIVFVPFFVGRSHGTELAIKLITYKKAPPPNNWLVSEDKSLSLNGPSSLALFKNLKQHLTLAEDGKGDGDYLVVKVSDGSVNMADFDPEVVTKAVLNVLSQDDILKHLKNTELSSELLKAFRGAIKIQEISSALEELRTQLNSSVNDEQLYQSWCERHCWIFGNSYLMRDVVRSISAGDNADLILPSVVTGFRDLIELKRPDQNVLYYDNNHQNFYLSAEVSKAIGQCQRYLDVFQEEALKGLRDHPEVVAYHPKATIVIGRSVGWSEAKTKALHAHNRRLNGITIMTYDHLLSMGERLLNIFQHENSESSGNDHDDFQMFADDGDVF